MAVINKNGTYMALPSAIKRGSAIALDTTSVWYDRALMEFYAQGGGKLGEVDVPITAYVGQVLTLVDETNNTATAYLIVDEAGHLNEVGSAALGDNASIELVDGVLSVKDFGKKYYKYVAAVEGGEAAHYELTEDWVAGLEPRVVEVEGEMVIGWYEPNPTTVEGVKDQVVDVQNDVKGLEDLLNGTEDAPGLIEEVDNIAEALYGTEGENPVPGLIDQVGTVTQNLAENYYKKSETYNKSEVDGLVSGVFHFEGVKDSYDALPSEDNTKGDVYQVGEKEYAWNGTEWVELGFVVDLSGYYNKSEVDTEIKKVQDALDLVEENVADLVTEDERLAGLIDGHEDRIADLETAKAGFDTHFETVDGDIAAFKKVDEGFVSQFETVNGVIEALQSVDQDFEARIGTLEANVGDRGDFDTVYKEIFNLHDSFGKLTVQGGEPNQLNGISINGTRLTPNETTKVVALPIFAGETSGLVPVASELEIPENHFLNAQGDWINLDAMMNEKIEVALTWSNIAE